jgi:6-phosphogluconolactonase (cycloisomerase 2 family)
MPRHVIFHPAKPLAYLINELESSVTTYNWDSERGEFKFLQEVPATPSTFSGENKPSEIMIAPSGNFVFLSNRGHDSITTYRVDARSGTLEAIHWEPTQGKKPRFATLDPGGSFLYAANEVSNTIVSFRVDNKTGKLTPTGQIVKTGTPTCIVFAGS